MPEEEKKQIQLGDLQNFFKGYLIPTLSIVILILVLVLVTVPTIGKIQENLSTIEAKGKEVDELESFLNELEEISQQESVLTEDNLLVDQYLPKQSRVSTFIDNLNNLATTAGLASTELTGSETITTEGDEEEEVVVDRPRRVLVTFNYKGTFDEVYKLFEEINGYEQLLSVQSVQFSKRLQEWSVEITVASYNIPQDTLDQAVQSILESRKGKLEVIDSVTLQQIKSKL